MDIRPKDASEGNGLDWRKKSRRTFTPAQRLAMVLECARPGVSVAQVAQRNGINANLLFTWRKLHGRGQLVAAGASTGTELLPVTVVATRPKRKGKTESRIRRRKNPVASNATTGSSGAIEIELAGARIYLHGVVSESNLMTVLKALARR
jgi:transposase